jgi:hypothetical protein
VNADEKKRTIVVVVVVSPCRLFVVNVAVVA